MALLGTDRRPVPEALPPPAGPGPRPTRRANPTQVVLGLAARHRAAVRAGSALPIGRRARSRRRTIGEPGPPEAQQELADALQRGTAGPVNDALAVLVDQDGSRVAPGALDRGGRPWPPATRAWTGRCSRPVLGVRGVWFVGQNPQWARLAAALRNRRTGAAT